MAIRARSKRTSPTVSLRCSKCGGKRIRVSRTQQMLKRTFRRDSGQTLHLHAACHCVNASCRHEWWSAHETAIETSKDLDAKGQESRIVDSTHPSERSLAQEDRG
jgi:hypothetical protein